VPVTHLEVEEFIVRGAGYLEVSLDDLRDRGRASAIERARELLATLGVERSRQRVNALAAVMNKSPEVISRCVSRGVRLRTEEPEFEAAYEGLDEALADAHARREETVTS
jgi:hypothetical protein